MLRRVFAACCVVLLFCAGAHAQSGGDPWQAAAQRGTQAVEAARTGGDPARLTEALARRAEAYQALGHRPQALADLEEAAGLLERNPAPPALQAAVTGALGQAYFLAGSGERAQPVLARALELARSAKLPRIEAAVQNDLGLVFGAEGKSDEARENLDDVWESAERGPYPIFQADAFNVLAQIERDAGNLDQAIEAATQAYRLAWCDGPPFAYHCGLIAARKHLEELGAPEPEMPPFDESKFEPMPEVEIDPNDEFHAGRGAEDS